MTFKTYDQKLYSPGFFLSKFYHNPNGFWEKYNPPESEVFRRFNLFTYILIDTSFGLFPFLVCNENIGASYIWNLENIT